MGLTDDVSVCMSVCLIISLLFFPSSKFRFNKRPKYAYWLNPSPNRTIDDLLNWLNVHLTQIPFGISLTQRSSSLTSPGFVEFRLRPAGRRNEEHDKIRRRHLADKVRDNRISAAALSVVPERRSAGRGDVTRRTYQRPDDSVGIEVIT